MRALLCFAFALCSASALAGPESEGFSPARLDRATHDLQAAIDQKQYAGAVALVARRGHIVQSQALGYRDVARRDAMRSDAIFQIYSMTKPITSVAALTLLEQGKLGLDDPVSRYLPGFANMQVLDATGQARPAARPITIKHLLTHTAGFAAGEKLSGPAVERLEAARVYESPSLEAYANAVAAVPLANDPGTRFSYDGVNTEVLSRVIEVVAGMPFARFVHERVIDPLRMVDTDFSVPPAKRARIVEMTSTDETGSLVVLKSPSTLGDMLKRYPSGAGGLYSTAADYLRFCQMLLNGGELDGVSILGRKTVELMMSNHLGQLSPPVNEFNDGEGFGLGGYVVLDPARRGQPGSVGQFGWSGAAATWFFIDRQEQLISILMMQHLPRHLPADPPRLGRPFNALVYQALVNAPRKIVLIGGPKSEAPGRHDYANAVRVLDQLLRSSPDLHNADIQSHPSRWPDDAALEGASTVVWYFDGLDQHPLLAPERRARFEALMKAGVGLVVLHQAGTVPAGDRTFDLQRWLGGMRYGMFDRATEMAEIAPAAPTHPVSRGIGPFTYFDEFYPTLRWQKSKAMQPILRARLHVEYREGQDLVIGAPVTSTVAWVYERPDGGRAFGFTGGHYLASLDQPSVRKLILNAIAWTAHIDVPAGGMRSLYPDAAKQAVGEAVVTRAADTQVLEQPWGKLTWYVSAELGNSDTMTVGEAVIKPG